jgi:signal peptidase I
MLPTLRPDERLLVDRLILLWRPARRLEIVLFQPPGAGGQLSVKRVVGLPGEQVTLWDGVLAIDDQPTDEPYRVNADAAERLSWHLGQREYLLLGDNRRESTDSRTLGPVAARRLLGVAWYRYWPTDKRGLLACK